MKGNQYMSLHGPRNVIIRPVPLVPHPETPKTVFRFDNIIVHHLGGHINLHRLPYAHSTNGRSTIMPQSHPSLASNRCATMTKPLPRPDRKLRANSRLYCHRFLSLRLLWLILATILSRYRSPSSCSNKHQVMTSPIRSCGGGINRPSALKKSFSSGVSSSCPCRYRPASLTHRLDGIPPPKRRAVTSHLLYCHGPVRMATW